MIQRLTIIIGMCMAMASLAAAQHGDSLAENLLDVMGEGPAFNHVREQKLRQFEQRIAANTNLSEQAKADLARIPGIMTGVLSWESIKTPLAAAYSETFTDSELQELIAFFRSPIGEKYLTERQKLEKRKAEIILKLSAEAAAESANADNRPTEVLIPSLTGMQTVTVGNAAVSADDVLKEMNRWDKKTEPGQIGSRLHISHSLDTRRGEIA